MELGLAASTSICRTVFDEASILDGPCIFVSRGLNSGPESAPESEYQRDPVLGDGALSSDLEFSKQLV